LTGNPHKEVESGNYASMLGAKDMVGAADGDSDTSTASVGASVGSASVAVGESVCSGSFAVGESVGSGSVTVGASVGSGSFTVRESVGLASTGDTSVGASVGSGSVTVGESVGSASTGDSVGSSVSSDSVGEPVDLGSTGDTVGASVASQEGVFVGIGTGEDVGTHLPSVNLQNFQGHLPGLMMVVQGNAPGAKHLFLLNIQVLGHSLGLLVFGQVIPGPSVGSNIMGATVGASVGSGSIAISTVRASVGSGSTGETVGASVGSGSTGDTVGASVASREGAFVGIGTGEDVGTHFPFVNLQNFQGYLPGLMILQQGNAPGAKHLFLLKRQGLGHSLGLLVCGQVSTGLFVGSEIVGATVGV